MNLPLICHPPSPRSKRNVRVIRGAALLMSGSEIGANTASSAAAGTLGDDSGSGSKLPSATAPPVRRNSSSWSPLPGRQDLAGRSAAVDLLEAVLEADPRRVAEAPGDLGEVDDDVVALRHATGGRSWP